MIAMLIAGMWCAFAFSMVLAAGFFLQAWRRRRAEVEYMLLSLSTLAVAVYVAAAGASYAVIGLGAVNVRGLIDITLVSTIVFNALLVHVALRFSGHPAERRIVNIVYPAFGVFLLPVALDAFWADVPERFGTTTWLGVQLPVVKLGLTAAGHVYVAFVGLCTLGVVALFASAARRRGEGVGAAFGVSVLALTIVNDALGLGMGLYDSVSLVPFGYLAFVFAQATLLVRRYGELSAILEKRKVELRQRSDELARSLVELEQTQEEALRSEQLAVVGEFAAVITHEVRNPMAIVSNAVTTLRSVDEVTDDTRSLLAIIEEEMGRLERLVTLLLNYARPVVPQRQPHDLRALLESCMQPVYRTGTEVAPKCDGPWPALSVDAELMRQAFDNIIVNALQAMGGRGDLAVHVTRRRVDDIDCVVIGFEDDGEGMAEHQLEQALSPFYTTRPSGTGLGLAICDRIIDAHGGGMIISSRLGVGTAVSVVLPVKPDERLGGAERRVTLASSF